MARKRLTVREAFFRAFCKYIAEHQLIAPQGSVPIARSLKKKQSALPGPPDLGVDHAAPSLLAVSGGVDSVVMAHLFYQAGLPFGIAHAHFQLNDECERDAHQVRKLAASYGAECFIERFEVEAYAQVNGLSMQMAARKLRYGWFETLRQAHGYAQVATAHHTDDSLETMLRHLCKGGGLLGLQGILPRRPGLIRPMLFTDKQGIYAYARAAGLSWCEDRLNQTGPYERNHIRHHVVPALQQLNPSLAATVRSNMHRLQQTARLFQEEVGRWQEQVWQREGAETYFLEVASLLERPWASAVLIEWLQPYGFSYRQIAGWCRRPPQAGRTLYAKEYCLLAEQAGWRLARRTAPPPHPSCMLSPASPTARTPVGQFTLTLLPGPPPLTEHTPHVALLDAAKLTFPLTIRPWQAGDKCQPAGMGGKHQKVSDLLTNMKVPHHERAAVYVVCDATGEIAWVASRRVAEPFRPLQATQEVWQLHFEPATLLTQELESACPPDPCAPG